MIKTFYSEGIQQLNRTFEKILYVARKSVEKKIRPYVFTTQKRLALSLSGYAVLFALTTTHFMNVYFKYGCKTQNCTNSVCNKAISIKTSDHINTRINTIEIRYTFQSN